MLSVDNKERCCDIVESLLLRFKRKDFLYKVVIGDENRCMTIGKEENC